MRIGVLTVLPASSFCKIHTGLNFPDVLEKVEAIEDSFVFFVIIVVHPLTPSTNATTAV